MGMPDAMDVLRRSLKRPVTLDAIEAVLGANGVRELRRRYFPRWRRSRTNAAAKSLRGYKAVVVEDQFEWEVVQALAPRELTVRRQAPETTRTGNSTRRVEAAL